MKFQPSKNKPKLSKEEEEAMLNFQRWQWDQAIPRVEATETGYYNNRVPTLASELRRALVRRLGRPRN